MNQTPSHTHFLSLLLLLLILPPPSPLPISIHMPTLNLSLGNFAGGSDCKASTRNAGDLGSIPGSGRSPGEGNSNPLHYSCLENPMDGGAWSTVHKVAKSGTQLSDFTFLFLLILSLSLSLFSLYLHLLRDPPRPTQLLSGSGRSASAPTAASFNYY